MLRHKAPIQMTVCYTQTSRAQVKGELKGGRLWINRIMLSALAACQMLKNSEDILLDASGAGQRISIFFTP